MFESSQDILNISISLSVIAVAIFLCIALFYLILNLKRINKFSSQLKKSIEKIENVGNLIQDKIKQSGAYFLIFKTLSERIIEYFSNKREKRREAQQKESKKKESNKKIKGNKKSSKKK